MGLFYVPFVCLCYALLSAHVIAFGASYLSCFNEAAVAFSFIADVPLMPGWITPAILVVLLYLKGYEPGPEAIRALFTLQLEVAIIFCIRCNSARLKTCGYHS